MDYKTTVMTARERMKNNYFETIDERIFNQCSIEKKMLETEFEQAI